MKTRMSRRILLIVSLSALLTGPALAAFGDSTTAPAANALPPGTYPSSQADADKKPKDTDKTPPKPADSRKAPKEKSRSGN